MHAPMHRAIVVEIEEDPRCSQADDACVPVLLFPVHEMTIQRHSNQLPFQELSHPSLVRAVLAQGSHFVFGVNPLFFVQHCFELSMNDEIRVATNWACEVRIGIEIQAKMSNVIGIVSRPIHQLKEPLINDST